jgi:hypothetical protein
MVRVGLFRLEHAPSSASRQDKGELMHRRPLIFSLTTVAAILLLTVAAQAQAPDRGFYPPQQAGAGGGPYFGMLQLSIPELDTRLEAMGLDAIPEWMTVTGGGGSFHWNHFLVGGMGYGASFETSRAVGGISRKAELSVGRAGVLLGYVKAIGNMKLTVGSMLGAGSFEMKISRAPLAGPNWTDVWTYYDAGFSGTVDAADLTTTSHLTGNYFWAEPFVSLRYWVIPLIAVDVGAFYSYGRIGAGKLEENGRGISGSPELDLSGLGFRFGVFLGF